MKYCTKKLNKNIYVQTDLRTHKAVVKYTFEDNRIVGVEIRQGAQVDYFLLPYVKPKDDNQYLEDYSIDCGVFKDLNVRFPLIVSTGNVVKVTGKANVYEYGRVVYPSFIVPEDKRLFGVISPRGDYYLIGDRYLKRGITSPNPLEHKGVFITVLDKEFNDIKENLLNVAFIDKHVYSAQRNEVVPAQESTINV